MIWRTLSTLLVFCSASGCVQPLAGKDVAADQLFYFPGRFAGTADGSLAWFVNQNFDQSYRSGWVTRIDVAQLTTDLAAGKSGRDALSQDARVLSLSSDFRLDEASGLAYVGHRGSGKLTVLELSRNKTLSCSSGGTLEGLTNVERQTSCDRDHIIALPQVLQAFDASQSSAEGDSQDLRAYYADLAVFTKLQAESGEVLVAGYLDTPRLAALTLLSKAPFVAPVGVVTLEGRGTNQLLARAKTPGTFFSASLVRVEDEEDRERIGGERAGTPQALFEHSVDRVLGGAVKSLSKYGYGEQLGGYKASSLVASPNDADVLFVSGREGRRHVQRDVVAILRAQNRPLVDRTADGNWVVSSETQWKTQSSYVLDRGQITDMVYFSRSQGDLLVASSLMRDELYFFDIAYDRLTLVRRIALPSVMGPYSMRLVGPPSSRKLLVTTFFDHGLAVVDVASADPNQFGLIAHIQDARPEPSAQRSR